MTTYTEYNGYKISWRHTGERLVALVRLPGESGPPAVITASVSEGMDALKTRTRTIVDAGVLEAYRPNLANPGDASPFRSFMNFLVTKEKELGELLSPTSPVPQRLSGGWAFNYQSLAFVETGNFSDMLVGHGPVIITDDGRIVEGGSLDFDPEALLRRI